MARTTITIELQIKGRAEDAQHVVDGLLDAGFFQDAMLERAGAAPLAANDNAAEWLARWLPRLARRLVHAGNYKYAFPLDRAARRCLPASLAYPKVRAPFQMRLVR